MIKKIIRKLIRPIQKSRYHTIIGVIFVVYGVIAFFTPLTAGSWLFFVGLALLGWHQFDRFLDDK